MLSDGVRKVHFERVTAGEKAEKPIERGDERGDVARTSPSAVE